MHPLGQKNNMKTTCQICERDIKARTGFIAHHGYQRPGGGWQTESCWGARHLPYEVSCDQIQPCIDYIKKFVSNQRKIVIDLMQNPPESITDIAYIGATPKTFARPEGFDAVVNEKRGSYMYNTYEQEHHHRVHNHKRIIDDGVRDIKRLEKRLLEWKPQTI